MKPRHTDEGLRAVAVLAAVLAVVSIGTLAVAVPFAWLMHSFEWLLRWIVRGVLALLILGGVL